MVYDGLVVDMVMLNYSKPLDVVLHTALLRKLRDWSVCQFVTFEAPTAPAGQKVVAKLQRQYTTVWLRVRQQIYTAIAAGSNAHCRQLKYNHAKQKNKMKHKNTKKI